MSAPEVPEGPTKDRIDAMTQTELAAAWRFAPVGDPLFQPPFGAYVQWRLRQAGGITPAISKGLGW